ncbi:MAG TPA: carbohydrate kinase [Verrucomicrobiae bacterium]|nr:carbohydrate kinase [Verrucomicrobiae bacterium]
MKYKIVGIGELLWDFLPSGKMRGGAPGNFVYHASALGAEGKLISRVGNDPLGHELTAELKALELSAEAVQIDPVNPTGTVTVELCDSQPRFTIHEGVAWDHIELTDPALQIVRDADAICFGSLAQRHEESRNAIQKLVSTTRASTLRIFDVNLRQHFFSREIIEQSLKLSNVVKLNDAELPIIAGLFDIKGCPADQLKKLARQFNLRLVALTRGERGSLLYSMDHWFEHPGFPGEVKDTVGAGDSFTAALTIGLLQGLVLDEVNRCANELASFVCSQDGATPLLPERLLTNTIKRET